MKRWRKTLAISLAEITILLVLHSILIHYLAESDTMSVIFSAGNHVPKTALATAGLFLLVRFMVILALPGMILSRSALVIMDRFIKKDV